MVVFIADYVLVHGGHKDGSIWGRVVSLLEEQGHKVLEPFLPDVGTSTLVEVISVVCELFEEEVLEDVILAGHSSGASTITGVADRMPEQIAHLVYMDS
ncbi:MAG: alpha/beta hydrolase [Actinomycetota bacterium]|nr:alpha/beta hydrolase [Actinomycetota bacterium]